MTWLNSNRQYISPEAEKGYQTLGRMRREVGVQQLASAGLLAGGLGAAAHGTKFMPPRGLAQVSGGLAAAGLGALASRYGWKAQGNLSERQRKIRAKAEERRGTGQLGRGRKKTEFGKARFDKDAIEGTVGGLYDTYSMSPRRNRKQQPKQPRPVKPIKPLKLKHSTAAQQKSQDIEQRLRTLEAQYKVNKGVRSYGRNLRQLEFRAPFRRVVDTRVPLGPGEFYHGTSRQSAKRIKREGFSFPNPRGHAVGADVRRDKQIAFLQRFGLVNPTAADVLGSRPKTTRTGRPVAHGDLGPGVYVTSKPQVARMFANYTSPKIVPSGPLGLIPGVGNRGRVLRVKVAGPVADPGQTYDLSRHGDRFISPRATKEGFHAATEGGFQTVVPNPRNLKVVEDAKMRWGLGWAPHEYAAAGVGIPGAGAYGWHRHNKNQKGKRVKKSLRDPLHIGRAIQASRGAGRAAEQAAYYGRKTRRAADVKQTYQNQYRQLREMQDYHARQEAAVRALPSVQRRTGHSIPAGYGRLPHNERDVFHYEGKPSAITRARRRATEMEAKRQVPMHQSFENNRKSLVYASLEHKKALAAKEAAERALPIAQQEKRNAIRSAALRTGGTAVVGSGLAGGGLYARQQAKKNLVSKGKVRELGRALRDIHYTAAHNQEAGRSARAIVRAARYKEAAAHGQLAGLKAGKQARQETFAQMRRHAESIERPKLANAKFRAGYYQPEILAGTTAAGLGGAYALGRQHTQKNWISKAGEWKTIEQRERAGRDARRQRNRGLAAAGFGASGTGALVAHQLNKPDGWGGNLLGNMQRDWRERNQVSVMDPRTRQVTHLYSPPLKSKLAHAGRQYAGSLSKPGKLMHGAGLGLLAGGLGTAAAMHGVNRYHQAKINQRRKENMARKQLAKKNLVSKLSGYDTETGYATRVGHQANPRAGKGFYSEKDLRTTERKATERAKRRLAGVSVAPAVGAGVIGALASHKLKTPARAGVALASGAAAGLGTHMLGRAAARNAGTRSRRYMEQVKEPERNQVWEHKNRTTGASEYKDQWDRPVKGSFTRFPSHPSYPVNIKRTKAEKRQVLRDFDEAVAKGIKPIEGLKSLGRSARAGRAAKVKHWKTGLQQGQAARSAERADYIDMLKLEKFPHRAAHKTGYYSGPAATATLGVGLPALMIHNAMTNPRKVEASKSYLSLARGGRQARKATRAAGSAGESIHHQVWEESLKNKTRLQQGAAKAGYWAPELAAGAGTVGLGGAGIHFMRGKPPEKQHRSKDHAASSHGGRIS